MLTGWVVVAVLAGTPTGAVDAAAVVPDGAAPVLRVSTGGCVYASAKPAKDGEACMKCCAPPDEDGVIREWTPPPPKPPERWYFLATFGWRGEEAVPRQLGPYASLDLCRAAGRKLAPYDRRFWPRAEVLAAEKADRERAEAATAARKAAIEACAPSSWCQLPGLWGGKVRLDGDRNEIEWAGGYAAISSSVDEGPEPVSGCMLGGGPRE